MIQDHPTLTEEDFVLESDPTIKDDYREFCIIIKQTRKGYALATRIRDQILTALNEYPKLKIIEEEHKEIMLMADHIRKLTNCPSSTNLLYWLESQNQNLKAENEELKQKQVSLIEKLIVLQQEIGEFKQGIKLWQKRLQSKGHLIQYAHEILDSELNRLLETFSPSPALNTTTGGST